MKRKRNFFTLLITLLFLAGFATPGFATPVFAAAAPESPQGLTISRYGTGRAEIRWNAVPEVTGYQVFYMIGKGKWKKLNHLTPGTFDIVGGISNKETVTVCVSAVKEDSSSPKSKTVKLKMESNALKGYPNFPAHPDFTYDKDGALNHHGVWTYIYSMDRVGEDFADSYYEKALKADHYSFISPFDVVERTYVGTNDKRYGDFRAETVSYTFTGYGEKYVITKNIVVGTKRSENYFSVTKAQ